MLYTVKAAARATGVSASRLRTWERRYGIPHPDRADSGRRLYDEDDLMVIRRMAALVEAGLSAAQAAEAAQAREAAQEPQVAVQGISSGVTALLRAAEAFDETAFLDVARAEVAAGGWAVALEELIF